MREKTWALALTVGLLGAGGATQAALVDAGNGLVNDTVLDITWVADASLSGGQSWGDLVDWAENLVYAGYDDWRLASMSVAAGTPTGATDSIIACQTDTEVNCRDNELGYMYTYYLPGNYGDNKTGDQTVGDVTLTGIQNVYWSGTEFASGPDFAWGFDPVNGFQFDDDKGFQDYGWAVRPGQVAAAPLPGTALLMALGFGAMALLRRARRRLW